jgi:hypothetical protein
MGEAMRRRDQLDATLASSFAWCFARPGAAIDHAGIERRLRAAGAGRGAPRAAVVGPILRKTPLAPSVVEPGIEPSRDRARAGCRALAQAIGEAWALADEDASARATKRLLLRADRLGVELVAMGAQSVEAVRLIRLFVRHGPKMTRRQRDRCSAVATLTPLQHPEAADLLVEIAVAGDRALADALLSDDDWTAFVQDGESVAARLADVIDTAAGHPCRMIAIDFVARLKTFGSAQPALRRALVSTGFGVRARALAALAGAKPCGVRGTDLVRVLRDLVAHAPPDVLRDDNHEEDERTLADAVLASLAHVQPPEAEEALLDLIDAQHDTVWLDEAWATEALAVAFPETAAAMVDHWLKCARSHERVRALAALERLPSELAASRLRLAASDPAFAVRDPARRQWLERFGTVCPLHVADLPGAALLDAPPSERFLSSLSVMQGRVQEARRAMARALLAEAPSRETLVLLLQLVGDDSDSAEPSFGSRDEGWAARVIARFGADGVEGMCALAMRFPEPESFGWMRRLGDLIERGVIAREHAEPLRGLAARHVVSADAQRVEDSVRLLARIGAPPEILDRLLMLALDDDFGAAEARALVTAWPDRKIDARLASEMVMALADRRWLRLHYASSVALERRAPAAQVIARRVLELAEHDPDAVDAAVECARHLRASGGLDDRWALEALARPESPIFVVAARAWLGSSAIRPALESALGSPARGGVSAVQAALALLNGEPKLSLRDRRLAGVLDAAPPVERAELVHTLCMVGAPLALVGRHLEDLLPSTDPAVTVTLVGVGLWLKTPKARALLRAVLPRVVDFELRSDLEEALGTAPAPYWAEG